MNSLSFAYDSNTHYGILFRAHGAIIQFYDRNNSTRYVHQPYTGYYYRLTDDNVHTHSFDFENRGWLKI